MRKRITLMLLVLVMLSALGSAVWYFNQREAESGSELLLYGNVDIRQVQLAFNGAERIAQMEAREGERVERGQLLATLDTGALKAQVRRAEAEEEIARVAAANAERTWRRTQSLVARNFVAQQQADDARAAYETAKAALTGTRAALDVSRQSLADASLYAPDGGVIRQRILEPGDMASPQRPVYTLALTDPLWVRAYVQGSDLGRLKPGMAAEVATDSYPGKRYRAWVGYIAPTAEFTPKSVETAEVRSSLVYQVRIFVCNPQDELRLGMPATVTVPLGGKAQDEAARCAQG